MAYESSIEWTDTTWNPVRGCVKVSPGCKNCYAETFAERWRGIPGHPYEFGFDLRILPDKLVEPLTWAHPRKVFVNSMSDVFQDGVPDEFIDRVFRMMRSADWHSYQVLTKRSLRLRKLSVTSLSGFSHLNHIWLGVSVEDRRHGVPRIEDLKQTASAIRFLSIEPLLEDLGDLDLRGIDWVIVGGESGHGARPMKRAWVNRVLRQCRRDNVAFFFKQWGGVRKKQAGRTLNGRTYDEYPIVPMASPPSRQERIRRANCAQGLMPEPYHVAEQGILQRA